jgi:hypothetical protein
MPSKVRRTIPYDAMKSVRIESINCQRVILVELLDSSEELLFFNFIIPPKLICLQIKHLRKKFLKYYFNRSNGPEKIHKSQKPDGFRLPVVQRRRLVDSDASSLVKRDSKLSNPSETLKSALKKNSKESSIVRKQQVPLLKSTPTDAQILKVPRTHSTAVTNDSQVDAQISQDSDNCAPLKIFMSKYTTVLALFLVLLFIVLIAFVYIRIDQLHDEITQFSYLHAMPE